MRDTITDDTPLVTMTLGQLLARIARDPRPTEPHADWLDQNSTGIGPKRTAKMVRRRLELGLPGAARVGRRWLISREALREELERRPEAVERLAAELAEVSK